MPPLRSLLNASPRFRSLAVPAALGLLLLAAVHLIDGPGSLSDRFYVGALELALAVACVPLAVVLLTRPVAVLWHAAGALCTAALVAFLISRTIGLPGSTDDIGNWGQPLGVLSLIIETAVIVLAALALGSSHRTGAEPPSPSAN